jgi:hypothetical protein
MNTMGGGATSGGAGESASMQRARELFFQYDGSGFYMSRDGVSGEYREYRVPPELERRWRQDLTAEKIAKLDQPGNWSTLNYLCHHNDTRFLHEVVRAEPLGELWKRVSYLELLLEYIERCAAHYPRRDIRAALHTVLTRTAELDIDRAPEDEREEQLRGRVRKLTETANLILVRRRIPLLRLRPGWLARLSRTFHGPNDSGA